MKPALRTSSEPRPPWERKAHKNGEPETSTHVQNRTSLLYARAFAHHTALRQHNTLEENKHGETKQKH
jgi:hypothetical protein